MSFFRKLFTKKTQPAVKAIQIPRAPRIHSDVFSDLRFTLKSDSKKINLPIINISSTGIALDFKDQNLNDSRFNGIIEIKDQAFMVQLDVVRKTDSMIGCKFTSYPNEFPSSLFQFFKLQFMASAFTEVNTNLLKKPEVGGVHWFVDGDSNEIYFIKAGQNILEFHISLGDHYIEGGKDRPLKTGTLSHEKTRDLGVKATRTIKFDTSVNPEILTQALQLLQYVEHFSDADFKPLKHMLS